MAATRLLIVEDEGILRSTLAELLGREGDLQIVGTAPNGREGLLEALRLRPDVILTDLQMPQMDGIELAREIREQLPQTAVVVLTHYDDDENLFAALKAGALSYVLKDASREEIAGAIRSARAGEGILSPGLTARVLQEFRRIDTMAREQRKLFDQLTPRESDVLDLLAGGLRNRQIAQRLGLAEKTVRNHVSTILGKMQANDRTEAALIGFRRGFGRSTDTPPKDPPASRKPRTS